MPFGLGRQRLEEDASFVVRRAFPLAHASGGLIM
jgi:hypothetical protein